MFVLQNRDRKLQHPTHHYDIVIGPVADDAMALLFRHFNDGLIDAEMLLHGLKYKQVSSQYLFHTEEAIKLLHKL